MRHDGLYIGKEGSDPVPVEKYAWKEPWISGGILVLVYAIYEGSKLVGSASSEATVYSSSVLVALSTIISTLYSIFLVLACVLSCVFIFIINNGKKKGLVLVFITVSFIIIWISFFVALIRFMVDCVLLNCADPMSAWIIRYYLNEEVAMEFRVLPDLLMNALCMIGIVLSTVTLGSHAKMIHMAVSILDDENARTTSDNVMIGDERRTVYCKIKDGVKACSL